MEVEFLLNVPLELVAHLAEVLLGLPSREDVQIGLVLNRVVGQVLNDDSRLLFVD